MRSKQKMIGEGMLPSPSPPQFLFGSAFTRLSLTAKQKRKYTQKPPASQAMQECASEEEKRACNDDLCLLTVVVGLAKLSFKPMWNETKRGWGGRAKRGRGLDILRPPPLLPP